METKRMTVTGRVQGVFFRAFVKEAADRLGVTGTVRNLPDGSVEVVAAGDKETMDAFVAEVWQGSPHSEVENVEISDTDPQDFSGFSII